MSFPVISFPTKHLVQLGLKISRGINYQGAPEELVQDTLRMGEGVLSSTGALVIKTGEFTGRSPKDRFFVKDESTAATIDWNDFNRAIDQASYDVIYSKMLNHLNAKNEIWIRDVYACADEKFRLRIRMVDEKPWSNLFSCNMFIRPAESDLAYFKPEWHVLTAPDLKLDPAECGVRQKNATVINFKTKTVLIAGTGYTGEIKKSIFTVLNYLLPAAGVLSMHCAANMGDAGDVALLFGLSGTGKTTLSADPSRHLIGDDEHGWSDSGIFNIEGGCYAKTINLSEEKEPEIFHAVRDGALLENVKFFNNSNVVDFSDSSITENTRVSYPIHFIPQALEPSTGPQPDHIFLLTCDASGVLPPIAKLTAGQAMYQFISGYTAKIAGTEAGITEPKPTFSACFGAPFLPLHPGRYVVMLGEKIRKHQVTIWLVNTGWTGGPYGTGNRIKLAHTRTLIANALEGKFTNTPFREHPIFKVLMPVECPGVPATLLNPVDTWQNPAAYLNAAKQLAALFIENFKRYEDKVSQETRDAAPVI